MNRSEAKNQLMKKLKITSTEKAHKGLFFEVKSILKKYVDASELNYILLTAWILGTYSHRDFETFPLLTIMARKRSGKTRTLKLCSSLCFGSDGNTSTSVTEAFLFRHKKGAVFFDEMERISSIQTSALRETMNAVYKRGNRITRHNKRKTKEGETYEEEHFYPFYPLALANINGFGDVLNDRAIQIILQRSNNKQSRLIEDFSSNNDILFLKEKLSKIKFDIPQNIFSLWNEYTETGECPSKLKKLFLAIDSTELMGRQLEIFFPFFIVANNFGFLEEIQKFANEYISMLEGDTADNPDDLLHEFLTEKKYDGLNNVTKMCNDFRKYLEDPADWINPKWFGRAVKRLGFVAHKRTVNGRVQIQLNINSTNTTNPINTTNTTNSTNKGDLVGLVELGDRVDNTTKPPLKEKLPQTPEEWAEVLP